MRKIILSVFILLNIIAIIVTLSHPLTVSYFSLRVICVALTFVLSLFFSLIRTSRFDTILSIISILLRSSISALSHKVPTNIYTN